MTFGPDKYIWTLVKFWTQSEKPVSLVFPLVGTIAEQLFAFSSQKPEKRSSASALSSVYINITDLDLKIVSNHFSDNKNVHTLLPGKLPEVQT